MDTNKFTKNLALSKISGTTLINNNIAQDSSIIKLPDSVKDCSFMLAGSGIILKDIGTIIARESNHNSNLKDCSGLFACCYKSENEISNINSVISGCTSLEDCSYMFAFVNQNQAHDSYSPIEKISYEIFDGCSSIKTVSHMFQGMNRITKVDPRLFTHISNTLEDASYVFSDCSTIVKIGDNSDSELGLSSYYESEGDSRGYYISLYYDNNIKYVKSLFGSCLKLKTLRNAFSWCSSLQYIPENLFCDNITGTVGNLTPDTSPGTQNLLSTVQGIFKGCVECKNIFGKYAFLSLPYVENISDMLCGLSKDTSLDNQNINIYIDEDMFEKCYGIKYANNSFQFIPHLHGELGQNFLK